MLSNDVSPAYFCYPPTTGSIYISTPEEDWNHGDEAMVARLNIFLYGTKDAAMDFVKSLTNVFVK